MRTIIISTLAGATALTVILSRGAEPLLRHQRHQRACRLSRSRLAGLRFEEDAEGLVANFMIAMETRSACLLFTVCRPRRLRRGFLV